MAMEKHERYVCIGFDDSSNMAECTVFSKPWITKLDKLCKQFPNKFKMTGEQMFDGVVEGKEYEFPKSLITIRQPTKRKKMTEEQKQAASDRMKKMHEAKKAKKSKEKKEKKVKNENDKVEK